MAQVGWRGHRHFLSVADSSREELESMLDFTVILEPYSGEGNKLSICRGSILQPIFFEPSSRTLKSFEAAMKTLGGDVLSPHLSIASSMEKGESEEDTVTAYAQNADILVIRHKEADSMKRFASRLERGDQSNGVRIINAGNGPDEHPTQALSDLHTVRKYFGGELDGITYILLGDLKYGRTVHSLILAAQKFDGISFVGFPVGGLGLPTIYEPHGYKEYDIREFERFLKDLDPQTRLVNYLTRVQRERIAQERSPDFDYLDDRERARILADIYQEIKYQVTGEHLDASPRDTVLLHPLPRGSEISDELFYSPHPKVAPIKQMRNGLPARMALIALYSGKEEEVRFHRGQIGALQ